MVKIFGRNNRKVDVMLNLIVVAIGIIMVALDVIQHPYYYK